jgi:hypothetical protein
MSEVIYVEALADARTAKAPYPTFKVFLAGGITGVSDWQSEVVAKMELLVGCAGELCPNILLMNPRRANFPMNDPNAAPEQIKWEHAHLRQADAISFWFAPETVQPIALFEYGYWLGQNNPLIVGCDPAYPRRQDVIIQTGCEWPNLVIHDSLDGICNGIIHAALKEWAGEMKVRTRKFK